MVGDNHTWLANRSAQCVKKGGGAASKPGLLQLWAPHCPKWKELEKEAVLGQLHSLVVAACACARVRVRTWDVRVFKSPCVCVCAFVDVDTYNVTTQMLYPLGSGARWIYRAALQRLAFHFQTSNFSLSNVVLIKPVHQWKLPELWTKFNHKVSSNTTLSEHKS